MTEFITLTKDEADKIRGMTSPLTAIDPVPLEDGVTFILPIEILTDPAHAKYLADKKVDAVKPVDITNPVKRKPVTPDKFRKDPTEIEVKVK